MTAVALFGADSVCTKPVAERINYSLFGSVAVGKHVSVVGRFSEGNKLTTTDGGILNVVSDQDLGTAALKGFVEVMGAKEDGTTLRATAILCLGEQVDVELWDDAVRMAHLPQLRTMFEPAAKSEA